MDCIFCDIIEGKSSAEVIYEDDKIISFLDIRPVNFGHALVIPKKHYKDFVSVPEGELSCLIRGTKILSKAIMDSLMPDGFNIVVNNGSAAGQSVFHFHFHIIPRFFNDDFKFRPNLKNYESDSMKEFADKIRASITI